MSKIELYYVDANTLVLTNGFITDYIRLTGSNRRPWYYIDTPYLPLSNTNRTKVNEYACERIARERNAEIDRILIEEGTYHPWDMPGATA